MSALPETFDECLDTATTATRRLPRCKAFCAGALLLLTSAGPSLAEAVLKDIKAYFAALPEVVFDQTTNGLDDEGRKVLLKKGRNNEWIYKRVNAGKAIVTAVHPTSIVTMRLMDLGHPVLQVHIQNEKVETFDYWQFDGEGKQLQALLPRAALWAAAAAVHDLESEGIRSSKVLVNPLEGVPSEIIGHVNAMEACRTIKGEALANKSTPDPAERQQALHCDKRATIEVELRRKHATLRIVGAMLDRAKTFIGD